MCVGRGCAAVTPAPTPASWGSSVSKTVWGGSQQPVGLGDACQRHSPGADARGAFVCGMLIRGMFIMQSVECGGRGGAGPRESMEGSRGGERNFEKNFPHCHGNVMSFQKWYLWTRFAWKAAALGRGRGSPEGEN